MRKNAKPFTESLRIRNFLLLLLSGTTKLPAKGGFTNAEKTVIYFVVNRFQIARMKNIVHTIDPAAYLTISEVADVFKSVASKLPEEEPTAK